MLVRGEPTQGTAPIWFVTKETWSEVRASIPGPAQVFAAACGFLPTPGRCQILPDAKGKVAAMITVFRRHQFSMNLNSP